MGTKDISLRRPITVGTVPSGPGPSTTSLTVTIAAGKAITISITTVPDNSVLALWNFLYTIVVDSLTLDSNGDYGYEYPVGTLIPNNSPIFAMFTEQWLDWAMSSDTSNERTHMIRIHNTDTASHTFYFFYKAYTFAIAPGAG